jgi:hypothetical protein
MKVVSIIYLIPILFGILSSVVDGAEIPKHANLSINDIGPTRTFTSINRCATFVFFVTALIVLLAVVILLCVNGMQVAGLITFAVAVITSLAIFSRYNKYFDTDASMYSSVSM